MAGGEGGGGEKRLIDLRGFAAGNNRKRFFKQHIKYFNFQSKIPLDHPEQRLDKITVNAMIYRFLTHKVKHARFAEGEGGDKVGAVAQGQFHESFPVSQDQPDFAAVWARLVQHLPGPAHDQDGRRPLRSPEKVIDSGPGSKMKSETDEILKRFSGCCTADLQNSTTFVTVFKEFKATTPDIKGM